MKSVRSILLAIMTAAPIAMLLGGCSLEGNSYGHGGYGYYEDRYYTPYYYPAYRPYHRHDYHEDHHHDEDHHVVIVR